MARGTIVAEHLYRCVQVGCPHQYRLFEIAPPFRSDDVHLRHDPVCSHCGASLAKATVTKIDFNAGDRVTGLEFNAAAGVEANAEASVDDHAHGNDRHSHPDGGVAHVHQSLHQRLMSS
jgi:hypothetical protein